MTRNVRAIHLVGADRAQMARTLRTAYEHGEYVRAIAARTGMSYGLVHHLLAEAGTTMRPRGTPEPAAAGSAMTDLANTVLGLLADIESAYRTIAARPAVREIGSQVRGGGGFGSRPPGVDLRVIDLTDPRSIDGVLPILASWAANTADDRRTAGIDDPGPSASTLDALCGYLRATVSASTGRPWVSAYLTELRGLRAILASMPGSPLWPRVLERADCLSLVGDDLVPCRGVVETRVVEVATGVRIESVCTACRRRYDDAAMARAMVDQDAALNVVTAAEGVQRLAVRGVAITEAQVRQWAARGRITRHGMRGQSVTYHLTELARQAVRTTAGNGTACANVSHVGDNATRKAS